MPAASYSPVVPLVTDNTRQSMVGLGSHKKVTPKAIFLVLQKHKRSKFSVSILPVKGDGVVAVEVGEVSPDKSSEMYDKRASNLTLRWQALSWSAF